VGQRLREAASVGGGQRKFTATRAQNRRLKVRRLPEEPLANACVGELSVAHNMALRSFDVRPFVALGLAALGPRCAQRARG
jgi:simple sugar transport system ATP-binding protein